LSRSASDVVAKVGKTAREMQLSFGGTWSNVAPEVLISMTQRLLTPRLIASTALVLAAGGLIGLACGSDSDSDGPGVEGNPLNPGPGATNGMGGTGATPSETPNGGGTGPVNTAGTEGQSGEVPLEPGNNPMNPGEPGDGDPPTTEPPPTALAPNCSPPEGDVPNLTLELVAGGLDEPLYVSGAPGDDSRLFIVQKGGIVRVLVNGELQEAPFINLNLSQQIANGNETGLLGMAFHPNYATNGLFYLHFSSDQSAGLPPSGDTVLAEFQVDAANRSVANPASRRVLLTVDQPAGNHNGGEISFGPDGMLYFGLGDGGGGNDQGAGHDPNIGNGQALNTLLGKLLRIDVNGRDVNDAYSIPANNLAAQTGQNALPEIWAYGLRNPWRFSFDVCTGDLYIGDVGQGALEEIDFLGAAADTRTIAAGTNFGWRIMEGNICRPGDTICNDQTQQGLALPVDTYGRDVGQSVTGGYVYRGSNVPGLRGAYLYADYQSARFFRFRVQNGAIADKVEITEQMRPAEGGNIDNISSFGRDNAGELYVTAHNPGAVYRVAAAQ
jgi:glucose/arabinose dehydrogenase